MSSAPIPTAALARALDRYRARDLAGARGEAEAAIAAGDTDPALLAFAGMAACQAGDTRAGADHLGRALIGAPADPVVRANLATALIALGNLDGALATTEAGGDDPRLERLAAWIHAQKGRRDRAIASYRRVVRAWPNDFETWTNLGNLLVEEGAIEEAVTALRQAVGLRPQAPAHHVNLAKALAAAERSDERLATMRRAVGLFPGSAEIETELALAEAAVGAFDAAEQHFRGAIARDGSLTAFVELGLLLENRNRLDALAALIAEADERELVAPEIDFLRAWLLRRQNRFAEALVLAEGLPETINPIRRAQLVAELADRLGDPDRAFAGFGAMNRAALAARPIAREEGEAYLREIEDTIAHTIPGEVARWTEASPSDEPSPIFVVGFPRSGTTLLDTLLMNVPGLHVLEELPVLRQAEVALGGAARLASIAPDEIRALRRSYGTALKALAPPPPGSTIVDKHPLHMARVPLIHRLFPDARIVFVERHPFDAVLSCFMANFQMNRAMVHFTDLASAAHLYDRASEAWTRAAAQLPLRVHRIRYERMVEDLEAEMKPLMAFLDLPWTSDVLDNRASAARRDHIRTASYAQVTEPIYRRAAGRWTRYAAHLAPVRPVLAPWAERLGYEV